MDDTDRDFLVAEELNADPFEGYLFEPEYSPAEVRQRREQQQQAAPDGDASVAADRPHSERS